MKKNRATETCESTTKKKFNTRSQSCGSQRTKSTRQKKYSKK